MQHAHRTLYCTLHAGAIQALSATSKGQVTVTKLLKVQQHQPPEHLRLDIEPLTRFGIDKVSALTCVYSRESQHLICNAWSCHNQHQLVLGGHTALCLLSTSSEA